jgi:hypothetical protein
MTRVLLALAPAAAVLAVIGVQALAVKYRRKREAPDPAEMARLERQERRRAMIYRLLADGDEARFWEFAEEQFTEPRNGLRDERSKP